ncbi:MULTISPECIES: hypothetical protein [Thermomonosporaceae]|uniref:hypothetical protein n=1 Tax=Thermomonosporaceae TaxID=2012 RepID=UPI00255B3A26|nr:MULTISPECIES: hypothetical protein [Thermomonosporaceae]MDL4776469.1 hypothetical protein [Actinomadura xylanilytica]
MALFGRAAWWLPSPLAKILPDVDVEGERLRHLLGDGESVPRPDGERELEDTRAR